ncbi:MAG TPA: hypothetical protein DIC36_00965 [Gammaproteobacteria bacterium]|nr:hypothetical protein [Gammaproteobacteria bacterium]
MSLAALLPQSRTLATARGELTLYPLPLDGLALLAANHRHAFAQLFGLFAQASREEMQLNRVLESFPDFVAHAVAAASLDRDKFATTGEYVAAINQESVHARKLAPGVQLSALRVIFEMLEVDLVEMGKLLESLAASAESLATQMSALSPPSASPSGSAKSSPPLTPL